MSAFSDAKRYFWLEGVVTDDDPRTLLKKLVEDVERVGVIGVAGAASSASHRQLESRVAELEAKLKEANARTRAVEHKNVQLEEQLKSDRLFKRIQELETEVKKHKERVRLVEHTLVQFQNQKSQNSKPQ